MPRLLSAALLACLLAALIAGCGSSGSDSDADGSPLASALETKVAPASGDEDERFFTEWVDTAKVRDLAGISDDLKAAFTNQRWQLPVGLALGDNSIGEQVVSTDYGFNPLSGSATQTIGQPPRSATLYSGVDTDGVQPAFEQLGFEQEDTDNGDFLSLGDEGSFDVDAVDETGQGPLGLNRVATDGDKLAVGAYEEPVAAAIGRSGETIAEAEKTAGISDCLGSGTFAALILAPAEGEASSDVALIGYGLQAPDGDSQTVPEEICVSGSEDADPLDNVADCMDSTLNEGVDPVDNAPFADRYGDAKITQGEAGGIPWVRATFAPPDEEGPVGLVFQGAERQSFSLALGGTPVAALGGRATPAQVEQLESQSCGS